MLVSGISCDATSMSSCLCAVEPALEPASLGALQAREMGNPSGGLIQKGDALNLGKPPYQSTPKTGGETMS